MHKPGFRSRAAVATVTICALAAISRAANVSFNYTYTDASGSGFNSASYGAQAQSALMAAGAAWAAKLGTSYNGETINVVAHYVSEGGTSTSAPLANASPYNLYRDFVNNTANPHYQSNTYYAAALANHIYGSDGNGTSEEIDVNVNSDVGSPGIVGGASFYYGTDGHPGSNQIDFQSVATHEIGHGLGILSLINQDGSFGGGFPSIYDTYLSTNGTNLTSLSQADRASALVGNNLKFIGPTAEAGYGGQAIPIYAPGTYQQGSSTSHVDQSVFDLMDPQYNGVVHTPSAIDFGILGDEGWTIVPEPAGAAIIFLALGIQVNLRRRRGAA